MPGPALPASSLSSLPFPPHPGLGDVEPARRGPPRDPQHGECVVPHLQPAGENDVERQGLQVRGRRPTALGAAAKAPFRIAPTPEGSAASVRSVASLAAPDLPSATAWARPRARPRHCLCARHELGRNGTLSPGLVILSLRVPYFLVLICCETDLLENKLCAVCIFI